MNKLDEINHKTLGITVLLILIVGCSCTIRTSDSNRTSLSAPIAYPYQTFRKSVEGDPELLPPSEWRPQLSDEQIQQINLHTTRSIVARQGDIWFTANDLLACYQPNTQKLKTYVVEVDNESTFVPARLFVTQNGELWGIGGTLELHWSGRFSGILSRYDAVNDRFEAVVDSRGILTNTSNLQITEDAQGLLWLVIDKKLFNFDPGTYEAQQILNSPPQYSFYDLVGAPDGTLWLAVTLEESPYDIVILHYDPHTEKIVYHGSPPDVQDPYSVNLYVDRHNRLWVNDYGWREFTPEGEWIWYRVIRSPVFLTDRMEGAGDFQYGWVRPYQTYESSNGQFWFSSAAGLVKLDPLSGEWNLVTTLTEPIVEDNNQNLWIGGARQLYKYSLEP